ncbi:porin family protein [soil metagenome]
MLTSYDGRPLSWGLTGGVSIADFYGDDVGGTETKAGFTGGIFFNYRVSDYFSIQPEALYTMKGSEVNSGIYGQERTTEYELGYIEIPVLLKLHIPNQNIITPNIYAGPNVAFNVNGDANDRDIDDDLKDVDFGLSFGGGVDFMIAKRRADFIQKIFLDARCTLGLVDVFDVAGDPEAKNGVFNITAGVGF